MIPVYNEVQFLLEILERVQEASCRGLEKEIIVVDDHSTDGTRDLLRTIEQTESDEGEFRSPAEDGQTITLHPDNIDIFYHKQNRGKGAALRTGFNNLSGDVVVIQDSDLEYNPREYEDMLAPILQDEADVVYGSRFLGGPQRVLYFWHYVGNSLLTLFSNMLSNLNLSDMETCYKMFRSEVLDRVEFNQDRFGFEPEFTAKVARKNFRIYEVPISYYGRTYEEGKKIGCLDGIEAFWCIIRYNLFS